MQNTNKLVYGEHIAGVRSFLAFGQARAETRAEPGPTFTDLGYCSRGQGARAGGTIRRRKIKVEHNRIAC